MTDYLRTLAAACIIVAPLLPGDASARDISAFTPARSGNGEASIGQQLEFPELRGDTKAAISCQGVIKRNGKVANHGCYRINPGDDTFIASVHKAIGRSRFIPATYDGREVDVVFQYRAAFVKEGDDQQFHLFPNPGYEENVSAYGVDHIAAQRLMDKEGWRSDCPKRAKFVVLVRANVDYDGTPGSVSIEHMDGIPITPKCSDAIRNNILESRFIPAHADEEPVPSTYVEPYGN